MRKFVVIFLLGLCMSSCEEVYVSKSVFDKVQKELKQKDKIFFGMNADSSCMLSYEEDNMKDLIMFYQWEEQPIHLRVQIDTTGKIVEITGNHKRYIRDKKACAQLFEKTFKY